MKTSNSTRVPDEILLSILKEAKLNPLELVKLAPVSKQFYRVSNSNHVWHDETPEDVRHAVAEKRAAQGPGEDRTEFKAAFMNRMAGRSVAVKEAYLELLLQPGQRTLASRLLEVPFSHPENFWDYGEGWRARVEAEHDYDVVRALVKQHTGSFELTFIDYTLGHRNFYLQEPEMALAILKKSPVLLSHFNKEIRDSKAHVMVSFTPQEATLRYASDRLRNDPEVVHLAVRTNAENYVFASELQQSQKSLFVAAFSQKPVEPLLHTSLSVDLVPSSLLEDPETAMIALRANLSYGRLPEATRLLPDVIAEGVRQSVTASYNADITNALLDLRRNDHKSALDLFHREPKAVGFIGDLLRNDLPFMRELASVAPVRELFSGGGPASRDEQTVRIAVAANERSGSLIGEAHSSLRKNSLLQWVAFQHGASVEDLKLDRVGAFKAWLIFKMVKSI